MTPEEFQAHQAAIDAQRQARVAEDAAKEAERQRMIDAHGKTKFDPKTQPTFASMNSERRAQERAEREAAERARIAALTPRQVWLSTLTWQEQKRIEKWEAANPGMLFPMPQGFTVALK